jgi:hypothetical protein
MRVRKGLIAAAIIGIISALLLAGSKSSAQRSGRLTKPIMIQAQAMGTSTQLGRTATVNLHIKELSTVEDQKALIEAFNQKKNEGLVNAISKMSSKGRMAVTGTLGYDVNYIRRFDLQDGSMKIRLVADRPLRFGEVWSDTRSSDYNLSAVEIIVSPDRKKSSGTLYPACQLKMDKNGELELELYQNPWKLVNIVKR